MASNHNNNNPSATTFVQADPSNFRDVVQRLTGANCQHPPSPQPKPPPTPQHSLLRLHQRRQAMRNNNNNSAARRAAAKDINNNNNNHDYYHYHNMLHSFNTTCTTTTSNCSSTSAANFVQLSPVSPLDAISLTTPQQQGHQVRVRRGVVVCCSAEELMEERAIAEKGFYLRPTTPKENEPQLLPLFPLHSPRVEDEDDEDDDDD